MDVAGMGIVGICFGVLTAQTRTPRFRLLPFLSLLILLVAAVILLTQSALGPPIGTLVFLSTYLVALTLYSAQIWRREGLGERYTFWELTWLSAWHPNQLRAAFQEHLNSAHRAATPPTP